MLTCRTCACMCQALVATSPPVLCNVGEHASSLAQAATMAGHNAYTNPFPWANRSCLKSSYPSCAMLPSRAARHFPGWTGLPSSSMNAIPCTTHTRENQLVLCSIPHCIPSGPLVQLLICHDGRPRVPSMCSERALRPLGQDLHIKVDQVDQLITVMQSLALKRCHLSVYCFA